MRRARWALVGKEYAKDAGVSAGTCTQNYGNRFKIAAKAINSASISQQFPLHK
jgi:hypothetical protein